MCMCVYVCVCVCVCVRACVRVRADNVCVNWFLPQLGAVKKMVLFFLLKINDLKSLSEW